MARLGAERLGLWSGVGSAGGRPQLRGAHCGPGPAAAARAQVMVASRGFSPLVLSAPAAHPQGRRPCGSLMLPPAHPLSSPAPPLSLPLYPSPPSNLCFSPGCTVTSPGPALRESAVAPFLSGGTCPEGEVVCEGGLRTTPRNHHASK